MSGIAGCRGRRYIDGSVTDFLYYDNSPLLKCGGQAFILDYSQVGSQQAAFSSRTKCLD